MIWLKANWVILVALVTMATAWGQQQQKVQTLEQAMIANSQVADKLQDVKEKVVRQEEQLKAIKDSQVNTENLLRILVQEQRANKRNQKD